MGSVERRQSNRLAESVAAPEPDAAGPLPECLGKFDAAAVLPCNRYCLVADSRRKLRKNAGIKRTSNEGYRFYSPRARAISKHLSPSFIFPSLFVEFRFMKYLLPCKCGKSVEVEPGQAGQTVACTCGENLLVPSMLQIKVLPVAPEKPVLPRNKTKSPHKAALVMFVAGIVGIFLSFPLWWFYAYIPFGDILFIACLGLGCALVPASLAIVLRARIRPNDTNILSRTFFTLGIVLLFPAFLLAIYLYLWIPEPRHAMYKRTLFSFGSNQRMLPQDSTPIPMEERDILWMRDEYIDQMMPMQLHTYFQTLREPTFSYNFRENYEAVLATYRIWVTVNVIVFILAFASIVVSFFMPKQNVIVTGWSGSEW